MELGGASQPKVLERLARGAYQPGMTHPADAFVEPMPDAIASLSRKEAVAMARERQWYHQLDFGEFVTPGDFDIAPVLDGYGFPDDLSGMTVLDVGRSSGFFAFEFERRGATVYATDLPPGRGKDFVPGFEPPRSGQAGAGGDPLKKHVVPFFLASRILGSRVRALHLHILDLSAEKYGTFDLVFAGSILNHVRDIAGAARGLHAVTGGLCIMATPVSKISPGVAALEFIGRSTTWWVPNAEGMLAIATSAGFDAHIHNPSLPLPFRDRFSPHAIVHGKPGKAPP